MKLTFLLVCFVASLLVANAQQPKMIFKMIDGTEKQYDINDLDKLSLNKSGTPSYLTVYYNKENRRFLINNIDSITTSTTTLRIFSKPTEFSCNLAEVDSIVTVNISQTQAPSIEWKKTYGGHGSDNAKSIIETKSGYMVAGITPSDDLLLRCGNGGDEFWLVHISLDGKSSSGRCFGNESADGATSIHLSTYGTYGYIVAGYSSKGSFNNQATGYHGGIDYWVVRFGDKGIIWQKPLGGKEEDFANSVRPTNDGGYIVAGYTKSNDGDVTGNHGRSDYWIVKLDSVGSIMWQKCLGGTGTDKAQSIQQTSDGGYIVSGITGSTDGDVTGNTSAFSNWVVKLNSEGSIQWNTIITTSWFDHTNSIQQTSDGGYIFAGGNGNYEIVKLNSGGFIEWKKSLGGSGIDLAYSIQQTNDGGYVVAGSSESNDGDVTGNHGEQDYWIVKLNPSGNIQWQKCYGGKAHEVAKSIQQTSDGGFIVAGTTNVDYFGSGDVYGGSGNTDIWVVKLNFP